MEPITTLVDRSAACGTLLPAELRDLYGGDLSFGVRADRPYVIGNFVGTLDGVVTFDIPGKAGGGDISGFNETDRFIMGLLRASADAVIIGARTLVETAPGHILSAEDVYSDVREQYARYRLQTLDKPRPPINVIVSGSGRLDLERAVFRTTGVRTLIITSPSGEKLLAGNGVADLESVEVRTITDRGGKIAPGAILTLLRDEFGVELLLHEGGPTLFGDFVAHGCMDELFLTVAPQFAGRATKRTRPGVISGTEFVPETAPWLKIVSVKQSEDYLYLRYALLNRRS
jgi:riboflavin biosynthesis pyrimidine reductase